MINGYDYINKRMKYDKKNNDMLLQIKKIKSV